MHRPTSTRKLQTITRPWSRSVLLLCGLALFNSCDKKPTGPDTVELTITPENVVLFVGASQQLTALGAAGPVTWSSSNTNIATVVAQTGFVQGVGRGEATITATVEGGSASRVVSVLAPPTLSLSTPTITFQKTVGAADPAAQTVNVTNAGDGSINNLVVGTISYGFGQPTDWLTATLSSATAPAVVTLRVTAGSLPRGTYTAIVPIQAAGLANSPQNIAVTFQLQAPASIVLSKATVTLATLPGGSASDVVNITNGGDQPLTGLTRTVTYAPGQDPGWLFASFNTTSAPATLTLNAVVGARAPGTYQATLQVGSILAGVTPQNIAVTLTIGPGATIQLSTATVQASVAVGGTAAQQTVAITNSGGGTLSGLSTGTVTYGSGQPTGWLTPQLSGTTAPANVTLSFNSASLAAGNYTATVPVLSTVASNSPQNISVTLTVGSAPRPPSIVLSTSSVTLAGVPGGTASQSVGISNGGDLPLVGLVATVSYISGTGGWLQAGLGSTTAPTNVSLIASIGSLPVGTYTANVQIGSSGIPPRNIAVTLTVSTVPIIQLSPSSIPISISQGANASQQIVSVSNGGSGTLSGLSVGTVTYGGGQPTGWVLAPSLGSTTAPTSVTLNFNTASLASGTYNATVPVLSSTAGNSPQNIAITLTVAAVAAQISLNPTSATFAVWGGGSLPGAQAIQVTGVGGTVSNLSTAISYSSGSGWLNATFQGGTTTPTNVLLQPATTALPAGTYTATVTVSSTQAGVTPKTVSVTYTVQTFTANVFPHFTNCSSCHAHFSGTVSAVYNAAVARVVAGNPASSSLVCKPFNYSTCNVTHGGGKSFPAAMLNALVAWITAGSPFQ